MWVQHKLQHYHVNNLSPAQRNNEKDRRRLSNNLIKLMNFFPNLIIWYANFSTLFNIRATWLSSKWILNWINSSEIDCLFAMVNLKKIAKCNRSSAHGSECKQARKNSRVERMLVFSAQTSVDKHRWYDNRCIKLSEPKKLSKSCVVGNWTPP